MAVARMGSSPAALVLCVALLGTWVGTALGFSFRKAGDDFPSCTCDCCNTARRLPGENSKAKMKCSPAIDHSSDVCTNECQAPAADRLLHTVDGLINYQRYCFYECKPADGPNAAVHTQCVELDLKDKEVVAANGVGHDPAAVYKNVQRKRAGLVSRQRQTKVGQTPAEAEMEADRGITQATAEGKEARAEAVVTRDAEEEAASKLNEVLGDHIEAVEAAEAAGEEVPELKSEMNPFAGIDDIHKANEEAEVAADGAGEAAQAALGSVRLARKLTWNAAVDSAKKAMDGVVAAAAAKAKADAEHLKRISNSQEVKMLEAAQKASFPFFISMLRAQQTAKEYRRKGDESAAKAQNYKKDADSTAAKANKANAAGKSADANSLILQAQDEMRKAQAYAKQARQQYGTADEIEKSIPKFQAAAAAASAKTVYDMNPAFQQPLR